MLYVKGFTNKIAFGKATSHTNENQKVSDSRREIALLAFLLVEEFRGFLRPTCGAIWVITRESLIYEINLNLFLVKILRYHRYGPLPRLKQKY